jgi:putative DNA primase/helicase
MIEGCADWLERGLAPSQIVTDAIAAYLESEDVVSACLEDCATRDASAFAKSTDGSQKRFSQTLETRGLSTSPPSPTW